MLIEKCGYLFSLSLCSASDGQEIIPFLLKETWTPLPLVEAGNVCFFTTSSLVFSLILFVLNLFSICVADLHFSFLTNLSFSRSGHFGLWVDGNLYLGRSSPCYTFNNCCLSETDDFRVMELEVWTFS